MIKFVYGSLPRQLRLKGYLPGHITKAFGPRYIAAGIARDGVNLEFGEFVELDGQNSKGYIANVVDAATALGTEAVVVRDVVGFDATGGGIVSVPKDNVTLSLFVPTEGNKGKIVAILGNPGGGTPAVGGNVFLGTGATTTVTAGAFVVGTTYTILVPGNTDFTLIGAADSLAGTTFVATGVGVGTGTANNTTVAGAVYATNIGTACLALTTWRFASTRFLPTTNPTSFAVEVEHVG